MPKTIASALATLWMAPKRLATYFMRLPLPNAPRSCTARLNAANSGISRLISAAPPAGFDDSAYRRGERGGAGQAHNDGRRRSRQLRGIGGDLDAGALERAAARRGDVVADDTPAGGAKMPGEGAAHDAETDDA